MQEINVSGVMPQAVLMQDLCGIGTDFEFDAVVVDSPKIADVRNVVFGEHPNIIA